LVVVGGGSTIGGGEAVVVDVVVGGGSTIGAGAAEVVDVVDVVDAVGVVVT
jgi:hypothetical protein